MTIKNLSLVLLTALSFIWVGCDNDDISNDTYVDIIIQVSEKTVYEPVWGSDTPVEHMLVKEQSARNGNRLSWAALKALNTCKDMPMS